MPLVSVIMPCFNHARFVGESVASVLSQSFVDLELLVIDDCSSDPSWSVIKDIARTDPRITALRHQSNQGASESRNDGLRRSSGEFVAFCDADDLWEKTKLEEQLRWLTGSPQYDICYCNAQIINERGAYIGEDFAHRFRLPKRSSGDLFSTLIRRNFINMPTVVMRRKCLQQAGYFDPNIKWVEDWWFWIKISRFFQFRYVDQRLAKYRVHGHSTSATQPRGYKVNRYKVLKRVLRQYPYLSSAQRATIYYKMAVELASLGKHLPARLIFRRALLDALRSVRGGGILCKAGARLSLSHLRNVAL